MESRNQSLVVTTSDEPLCVLGDAVRLEQVVSNLLGNACKYTPRGGHVHVSARASGSDGARAIEVSVKDNGMGIAPAVLPRVFNLFMHAGRSVDPVQGGLGIGLTLARRMVELHGGTIAAHSEGAGKGSEFVIHLPPCPETIETVSEAPPGSPQVLQPVAKRRVLVVDDNVDAADSQAMTLRLQGHEVEIAYDGPSALAAAESFRPEVVILDIALPNQDGYQLAAELRRMPGLTDLKLIAVTGYGHEEARDRARSAGFDHYVTKPAEPGLIARLVAGTEDGNAPHPVS
jgi:two-component system CheB/CheR fusion protein